MGQKNSAYDPICSIYHSRCTQVGVRPILLLYSDHQSSVVTLFAKKYEEPFTLLLYKCSLTKSNCTEHVSRRERSKVFVKTIHLDS